MAGQQIIGFALSPLIYSVADTLRWWYNGVEDDNNDEGKYDSDDDDDNNQALME